MTEYAMMSNKEVALKAIDNRVARLEKINDGYMAKHGEENSGIMTQINELMDERARLAAANE